MRVPPEWAVTIRSKMYANRLSGQAVALKLGKSKQWISSVLNGGYASEKTKQAICEAVDEIIQERSKHTA